VSDPLPGIASGEPACIPFNQDHRSAMNRIFFFMIVVLTWSVTGCSSSGGSSSAAIAPASSFLQTKASIVVIDFFDMYCHTCQTEAKDVNELHRAVKHRGMDSKVQFYAIGWGNSPLEAETYRTRFKVPFPVISDRDLAISKRYGSFRPPLLIALRREGGTWKEFYRTQHVMGHTDEILAAILP